VHQKGRKSEGSVPLVMMTHLARESNVQLALSEIVHLEVVSDMPALIRVEDSNCSDYKDVYGGPTPIEALCI
jgi:homoserine dehydrogenase